ncbi:FtsK/SpoIIIE domain-containing protein [Lactococcus garvieae]|uniref:FtsK/SpoIIIE domain-containing protein n=1 Tax=Lactococcus garvieae TaxID=1363 RepID=UPI0002EDF9BE|nr:FtsK/SpoIIIE domain-containing protein [Lactococcus garvieae]
MNKLFPKGHRLKKRDRRIPLRLYALVAVPVFCLTGGASVALYLLYGKAKIALVAGVSSGLILVGFLLSYWLYRILLKKSFFFIRKYRHFLLWRFMYQNNFYFTKERNSNNRQGKPKIYFPKVYLKQEKYELRASFQLEGIKFQEQFLKLGGILETMFSGDLMGTSDEKGFVVYTYAIDSVRGRISGKDVVATIEQGVKLAEGVYWDFVHDPHLIVAGGTGGGKTVFLRSIMTALLRIGVVEVLDPKESDFVKLKNLDVLKGRVTYTTEEMGQRLIDLKDEMSERYEIMRQRSDEQGEEELGAFYKYDMKPLFILIDELPSFMTALNELPYGSVVDSLKVDGALKQIVLKGRQAGIFVVASTQNIKADDLPSTLKDNMMTRITLGRVSSYTYDSLYGEENKDKHFKYVEKDGDTGQKIFGRGYYGIFGGSAREFYAPLLPDPKTYSFYMDFKSLPRIEKETSSSNSVEERFTLEEIANELNSDVRLLKKIKSKLIENSYEFASKDYSLKDKGLLEEILKVKASSSDTLDNIINEVVSRH